MMGLPLLGKRFFPLPVSAPFPLKKKIDSPILQERLIKNISDIITKSRSIARPPPAPCQSTRPRACIFKQKAMDLIKPAPPVRSRVPTIKAEHIIVRKPSPPHPTLSIKVEPVIKRERTPAIARYPSPPHSVTPAMKLEISKRVSLCSSVYLKIDECIQQIVPVLPGSLQLAKHN